MCDFNLSQIASCASPFLPVPPMKLSFSGFHTPSFFFALFSNKGLTIPSFSFPSLQLSVTRDELLLGFLFTFVTATFVANIISTLHHFFVLRVDTEAKSSSKSQSHITDVDNLSDARSTSSNEEVITVEPLDIQILKAINASNGGLTCKEIYNSLRGDEYTGTTKRSINSRIWRMAAKGVLVKNAELPPRWSRSLL